MAEGYLNAFEIRVDLVGEDTNRILYESIARAYFTTGNNRILTFHADVNTDSPTSVRNFVNPTEIHKAFEYISKEFGKPTPTVHVRGFYSEMKAKERRQLLNVFDASQDVFLLCSCETMGEGVDTKNANMCVFVDPKSSFVKIIQNIGRIVRKQFGVDKPHSTILLPIYIQKEKYEACTTVEECDARIREDMSKGGDFTPILNVLSALRQEDEDLYEICLHYPNEYSPQEIEENLRRQGYTIGEEVDIDEVLERVEEGAQLDVHSQSLEEPIVSHGESDHVINVLEDGDAYYEIQGEAKKIDPPGKRVKLTVHTNADVQVLWRLKGDLDLGSCLMDCEVIDNWNERLEQVKTIMNIHKRRPNHHVQTEKILATWLSHKINNYKTKSHGFKDTIRCKQWEEFLEDYKEYFKTKDEQWDENLQLLKEFINKHKRRPLKDDKYLYTWLGNHFHKYKTNGFKDTIRCKQWEEFVEEYKQYFKTDDEKWDENLQLLKEFINKHKRKPLKDDKYLYTWLRNQVPNYKTNGFKDPIRCKQWEEFLEEYKPYLKTEDEQWDENLQLLKEFINKHKRKPLKDDDKYLYTWFHNQSSAYNTKSHRFKEPIICKQWDEFVEEYKSYFKTDDEQWDENLQLLKIFMNTHKKRPTLKDDKYLCNWLQNQNKYYKKKEYKFKEYEHCKQWEEFVEEYKEYLKTEDEQWDENLQLLKTFMNVNKKRPTLKDNNYLCRWLGTQLTNYKTKSHGFKDTIRCKQWEEFLEEYKEYFIEKKSMKLQNTEPTETKEQKKQRVKSELSTLHQLYKTMRSDTLAQHFQDHPTAWSDYHTISESNEASFPEESIPRNQVIRELDKMRSKRPKRIVDMGCGKALISKHFQGDPRFTFINIDHVAVDETVQVGDISKLPLEEDSVEICILSLALWGSNCKEYIREAHRVLETNGILYLIEPTKRWTEKEPSDRLREALNIFHVKQETIEKFSFFTCIK